MKLASHNSLSFVKPKKWWEKLINFTSKCQLYDIETQYHKGVRLFDIRVRRDDSSYGAYSAKSGHGLITYDKCIIDVLYVLDSISTKEDPIYIQLNLENRKWEEDKDFMWFEELFKTFAKDYPSLIFCGGYVKHPWRKIIDCEDPTIDQKNWEFMNFKWQPTTKEKIKRFFANLFHFSPKYWAKKDNQKYKSAGTSADFLMLDYVQYGEF